MISYLGLQSLKIAIKFWVYVWNTLSVLSIMSQSYKNAKHGKQFLQLYSSAVILRIMIENF